LRLASWRNAWPIPSARILQFFGESEAQKSKNPREGGLNFQPEARRNSKLAIPNFPEIWQRVKQKSHFC
jgi:hypothetical protein